MEKKKFVEVEVVEKVTTMPCSSGCQRASGSPTGG